MNTRWYISTLIIILALLGGSVASQQHSMTPNQEIVLQFTTDEVTPSETQDAIAAVKQQLQVIGVDNIQVTEYDNGQLKITYYSDTDVDSIKKILSKEKQLVLGFASYNHDNKPNELPSDDNSIAYNLDIYELQDANDAVSNPSGKLGLEQKVENDRFFNSNEYVSIKGIDFKVVERLINTAYKFQNTIAIAIDNTAQIIPEVRAGPALNGIRNYS